MLSTRVAFSALISAGAVTAAPLAANADSVKDLYTVDVLGFRLGMTPDEIKSLAPDKIDSPTIKVNQGTLSMGGFKSSPLVFSVDISSKTTLRYMQVPNVEYLSFVFDQRPPYKVIDIIRSREFNSETTLPMSQFEQSVIEKYGKPAAADDEVGGQRHLVWNYGTSIAARSNAALTCSLALGSLGFAGQLGHGTFEDKPNQGYSRCGTWMTLRISPLSANPQLVGRTELDLGDVNALRESDLFILSMLTKGAQGAASEDQIKSSKNKAPL